MNAPTMVGVDPARASLWLINADRELSNIPLDSIDGGARVRFARQLLHALEIEHPYLEACVAWAEKDFMAVHWKRPHEARALELRVFEPGKIRIQVWTPATKRPYTQHAGRDQIEELRRAVCMFVGRPIGSAVDALLVPAPLN